MKILHIHVGLSLKGGVESMIVSLANEMAREHQVSVCALHSPIENGLYFKSFDESVQKYTLDFKDGKFSFMYLLKIYRFLRLGDFDVVNLHGFFYYYFLAILMLHNRIKFFYTFHSDARMENSKWDKTILWLKKFYIKLGWIKPITISPESKRSFTELYHAESRLIRNGIKTPEINKDKNLIDEFRITSNTKVFLHLGRISKPKNQYVLCKTFARLTEDGEDVVLLIAGTRQDEKCYKQIEPFLSKRIIYLGERNDAIDLLMHADGMCLPSIWEGLPIVLLESFSVGCIPICSPVGGIVGAISNGDNGLLSNSSSYEDYYKTMKDFLNMSNEKIMDMKEKCKESFPLYTIENTARQYINYYKGL